MQYKIYKRFNFEEYLKENESNFEYLCRIVDKNYIGSDLSRKRPRHPAEEKLLRMVAKRKNDAKK